MLSVRTIVNSRLKKKLKTEENAPYHGKILDFVETKQKAPTTFPTLLVDSLGEPSTDDNIWHREQCAIISTIELKAYSNTTLTDARKLLNKAGDVMISMGYSLIYGPEDISDTYKVMVARFRRIVGGGDIKGL